MDDTDDGPGGPIPPRRFTVLSRDEAEDLVARQPRRWRVISVASTYEGTLPSLRGAREICRLRFDDVEVPEPAFGIRAPRLNDVRRALCFAGKFPDAPLLIHCYAGISRSTALAWSVLFARTDLSLGSAEQTFHQIRRIRLELGPNRRVIELALGLLVRLDEPRAQIRQRLETLIRRARENTSQSP